jgi:hypothetical protein
MKASENEKVKFLHFAPTSAKLKIKSENLK